MSATDDADPTTEGAPAGRSPRDTASARSDAGVGQVNSVVAAMGEDND